MQAPRLEKISVNMGVGLAVQDPKLIEQAAHDLEIITGQKSAVTKAKKSISNFKLREKMPIGVRVTLHRARMYEFLDRLVNVAIPRIRDFRGMSDKSFDGRGSYSMGIKEQLIFPEVNVDKITRVFGMDVTFVTSAKTDEEAMALLQGFGMPFRKKEL
jgi:large subunit ribosomal protein L5